MGAARRIGAAALGTLHMGSAGVIGALGGDAANSAFATQRVVENAKWTKDILSPRDPTTGKYLVPDRKTFTTRDGLKGLLSKDGGLRSVVNAGKVGSLGVATGLVAGSLGDDRGWQVLGGGLVALGADAALKGGASLTSRAAGATLAVRGLAIAMGGNSATGKTIAENATPLWVVAKQADLNREALAIGRDLRQHYHAVRNKFDRIQEVKHIRALTQSTDVAKRSEGLALRAQHVTRGQTQRAVDQTYAMLQKIDAQKAAKIHQYESMAKLKRAAGLSAKWYEDRVALMRQSSTLDQKIAYKTSETVAASRARQASHLRSLRQSAKAGDQAAARAVSTYAQRARDARSASYQAMTSMGKAAPQADALKAIWKAKGGLPSSRVLAGRLLAAGGGILGVGFRVHAAGVAGKHIGSSWRQLADGQWNSTQVCMCGVCGVCVFFSSFCFLFVVFEMLLQAVVFSQFRSLQLIQTAKSTADVVWGAAGMTDMGIAAGKIVGKGFGHARQFGKRCLNSTQVCMQDIKRGSQAVYAGMAGATRWVGVQGGKALDAVSDCARNGRECWNSTWTKTKQISSKTWDLSKRLGSKAVDAGKRAADWTWGATRNVGSSIKNFHGVCRETGVAKCTSRAAGRAWDATKSFGTDAANVASTIYKKGITPLARNIWNKVKWN